MLRAYDYRDRGDLKHVNSDSRTSSGITYLRSLEFLDVENIFVYIMPARGGTGHGEGDVHGVVVDRAHPTRPSHAHAVCI